MELILRDIIKRIGKLPGISTDTDFHQSSERLDVDAIVTINFRSKSVRWILEFKKQITPALVPQLTGAAGSAQEKTLIIAEYITPSARKSLQLQGISYADALGNIFLSNGPLYILIETNNSEKPQTIQKGRPFTKTGLTVGFQLLKDSAALNLTYREISEISGASLDTISKVFKGLLQNDYILQRHKKEYVWNMREQFFLDWVNAYQKVLKPKLEQIRYKTTGSTKMNLATKLPQQTQWGGAVAAAGIVKELNPGEFLMYSGMPFHEIAKELRLVPDKRGNVILRRRFWKEKKVKETVSPILIYADLIHHEEPRYQVAAGKIYDKAIRNII